MHIGRRPIAGFGNSDSDLQMIQWTTAGPGARFGFIVHHTDAEREYACDRQSPLPLVVLTKPLTRPKRKAGPSWI